MRGSAAGALIYSKTIFLLKHRKKVLPAVKFNIRNLMGGLVIIVVLAFVFLRGDQINELAATMAQGAMIPLVIAILSFVNTFLRVLRTAFLSKQ